MFNPMSRFMTLFAAVSLAVGFASAGFAQDQAAGPTPGQHRGGGAIRQACEADVKAYCAADQGGGHHIGQCLREHQAQLSESCKAALAKMRGNGHGGDNGASPAGPAPQDSSPPKG